MELFYVRVLEDVPKGEINSEEDRVNEENDNVSLEVDVGSENALKNED